MANLSSNIWASTLHADGGSFYAAPLLTLLPTDPVGGLAAAFVDHGWMGEDGFTNGIKRDITKHRAFGGEIVKVTQDNYEETVTVTCMETNPVVLATVFGPANVTTSTASGHRIIHAKHSPLQLVRRSFVCRMIEGVKTKLLVIPEGQVTEIEDIVNVHDKPVVYKLTIDCFKPSGTPPVGNERAVNEHIDEPDVLAGT